MANPIISVAIPTFNSETTLSKTLDSIKKQYYPKNKVEVLVIDGGSTDKTLKIAHKYGTKIIPNPKTELIFAKHIGFLKAKGKYLINLDSDEVIQSPNSFSKRLSAFKSINNIKGLMPTGYKTPPDYSKINEYINDFGDPFSYFMYGLSQNENLYISMLKTGRKVVSENDDFVVLRFGKDKPLPIIELMAGSGMIDLEYFRTNFPQLINNPSQVAFYFYYMNQKNKLLAITKNDYIIHYSSGTIKKYLKRFLSRVKNNVFGTTMGKGGFTGREEFQPPEAHFKKYFFIPYSLSLILPFIDTVKLLISRKRIIYILHIPLCIYTSALILYYLLLKKINIKPDIGTYGN